MIKPKEHSVICSDNEIENILEEYSSLLYKPLSTIKKKGKIKDFCFSSEKGYKYSFVDANCRHNDIKDDDWMTNRCPYGKAGDILWVRKGNSSRKNSEINLQIISVKFKRFKELTEGNFSALGWVTDYWTWREDASCVAPEGSSFESFEEFVKKHDNNGWGWLIEYKKI